jgi:hypothetical protein
MLGHVHVALIEAAALGICCESFTCVLSIKAMSRAGLPPRGYMGGLDRVEDYRSGVSGPPQFQICAVMLLPLSFAAFGQ